MSIREDVTCIYTIHRKCSTIFTGNIPASKGTDEPSISRIWILISLKTLFFHGEIINILKTVFAVSLRIVNYSQCSEILVRHELWCDEVAINKYYRFVNERIRFNKFVRGAPVSDFTWAHFPLGWRRSQIDGVCEVCRENGAIIIGIQV